MQALKQAFEHALYQKFQSLPNFHSNLAHTKFLI